MYLEAPTELRILRNHGPTPSKDDICDFHLRDQIETTWGAKSIGNLSDLRIRTDLSEDQVRRNAISACETYYESENHNYRWP